MLNFNQNLLLSTPHYIQQREYWQNKFSKSLILSKEEGSTLTTNDRECAKFNRISKPIPQKVFDKLMTVSKNEDLSAYVLTLTALKIMLYRYRNSPCIAIASPIHKLMASSETLNEFVPLVDSMEDSQSFKECLHMVKETVVGAYKNQDYPIKKIVEDMDDFKGGDQANLYNILSLFSGIHNESVEYKEQELCFIFERKNHDLVLTIIYDSSLYGYQLVNRMFGHLCNILEAGLSKPDTKIANISILSQEEEEEILLFSGTEKVEYSEEKLITDIFEKQVALTPHRSAVISNNKIISYLELNNQINQLAHIIRSQGIKPDNVVAIMADRSMEMIIGLLAILKSGAAYLPILPDTPNERVQFMIHDSNVKLVLTQKKYTPKFEGMNCIDLERHESYVGISMENPVRISNSRCLAYVIYTSGSTGKPKGVMVEHHSVINRLEWMSKHYSLSSDDVLLQKTFFTFDVSVWELFLWFFCGASVCVLPEGGEKDPDIIIQEIKNNKVSIVHFVPSMMNGFLQHLKAEGDVTPVSSLKRIIVSGETLLNHHAKLFSELLAKPLNVKLSNLYGPTEATIDVSYFDYEYDPGDNRIPIGKPIDNTHLYIVDKNGMLQPVGVTGELWISGVGVARGYANRPELTNDKFIPCPFNPKLQMYKSGDLARWREDGNVEFLGRIDHQVKINGYRIELDEIESVLLQHPLIQEAVVAASKQEEENVLCAYLVSLEKLSQEEVSQFLRKFLPNYMIPQYYLDLKNIPRTTSGKIDRKVLPSPIKGLGKVEYAKPRNNIERALVEVFQTVLGVNELGINDNFYTLGGDSIKAIQAGTRLKRMGYTFEMKQLFQYPLISELSPHVKQYKRKIAQNGVQGEVRQLPIQKWFFEKNLKNINHWNQSVLFHSQNRLNSETIICAMNHVVNHHDALRMVFKSNNGEHVPYIRGIAADEFFIFTKYDLNEQTTVSEKIEYYSEEIQRSLDISQGPLIRVVQFHTLDGDYLLFVIHHLIIDTISWQILIEDFMSVYEQIESDEQVKLPEKTDSYQKWSENVYHYMESEHAKNEHDYWYEIDEVLRNEFAFVNDQKNRSIKNMLKSHIELNELDTKELLNKANYAYRTNTNELILTGLGLAIKRLTGKSQIPLHLEGHGREELGADVDISRTVGWFTSIYPCILDLSYDQDLSRMIIGIKEQLRTIPNKGIGYGISRYLMHRGDHVSEKQYEDCIPPFCFNFQGEVDAGKKNAWLTNAPLSTGANTNPEDDSPYLLNIEAKIVHDRLSISIIYKSGYYSQIEIQQFILNLKQIIINIKNHCIAQQQEFLTPSDYGDATLSLENLKHIKNQHSLKISKILPLVPMQEEMLFHCISNPSSKAFCIRSSFTLEGPLDINIFKKSLNLVLQKYEALRTRFVFQGLPYPRQVVIEELQDDFINVLDISSEDENTQEQILQQYLRKKEYFNLESDSLFKVSVITKGISDHSIILDSHHIIMDGWCLDIIMRQLFSFYIRLKFSQPISVKQQSLGSYLNWMNARYKPDAAKFWGEQLRYYTPKEILPRIKKIHSNTQYDRSEFMFSIDHDLTEQLKKMAILHQVTFHSLFKAVWGIYLMTVSSQNDVAFGSVVSVRPSDINGIEEMVGLFINTIPVRIKREGNIVFSELLKMVHKNSIEATKYNYYPLREMNEHVEPIIDHTVTFENYPFDPEGNEDIRKLQFALRDFTMVDNTNESFGVLVFPGNELKMKIVYDPQIYKKEMVENTGPIVKSIVEFVTQNNYIFITDLIMGVKGNAEL